MNLLDPVNNSFFKAPRPATCSQDPEILLTPQHHCTNSERSGSRELVVGLRYLNVQQILGCCIFFSVSIASYAGDNLIVTVPVKKSRFEVTLPANPTTGYQWSVMQFNKKLLTLTSSNFERSKINRIGAGGEMHFMFTLQKGMIYPESTHMNFQYARPWEQGSGMIQCVTVNFVR